MVVCTGHVIRRMGTTDPLRTGVDGTTDSVITVVTVLNELAPVSDVADVVSTGNTIGAESGIRRVHAGAKSDATDVHGAVDTVRTEQFLWQILASFNWIQDVLGTVDTIVAAASRCQIETSFVQVTTVYGTSNAVVAERGVCIVDTITRL